MKKNVSAIESNRTVADQFNEALFGRHDAGAAVEFLASEFVHRESGEAVVRGPEEAREYFEALLSAFPDVEMEVIETVVDDDRVVQFFEMSATHDGEVRIGEDRLLRATGERMNWHGFVSMRIEDGTIAEANLLTDSMAFYRQLGLIPMVDEFAA